MKTKIISKLKKELLIIELPTLETQISIGLHCIGIKPPPIGKEASDSNGFYHVYKEMFHGFKILGKPDEIKEDDLEGLFKEYKDGYFSFNKSLIKYNTKIRAFNKLIESEIYWDVNPLGEKPTPNQYSVEDDSAKFYHQDLAEWEEAQEKTFDRNRSLIFLKIRNYGKDI